jgi:hypothetical protein
LLVVAVAWQTVGAIAVGIANMLHGAGDVAADIIDMIAWWNVVAVGVAKAAHCGDAVVAVEAAADVTRQTVGGALVATLVMRCCHLCCCCCFIASGVAAWANLMRCGCFCCSWCYCSNSTLLLALVANLTCCCRNCCCCCFIASGVAARDVVVIIVMLVSCCSCCCHYRALHCYCVHAVVVFLVMLFACCCCCCCCHRMHLYCVRSVVAVVVKMLLFWQVFLRTMLYKICRFRVSQVDISMQDFLIGFQ